MRETERQGSEAVPNFVNNTKTVLLRLKCLESGGN